jgi:hypothetical protein
MDREGRMEKQGNGGRENTRTEGRPRTEMGVGCALTFASEAKFEIEAKISFRLEAKKKTDFT